MVDLWPIQVKLPLLTWWPHPHDRNAALRICTHIKAVQLNHLTAQSGVVDCVTIWVLVWKCASVLVCCVSAVLFVFSCLDFVGLDLFSLLVCPPGNELGLKLLNLKTPSVFIPLGSPVNPDFDRLEYSILYFIVPSQLVIVRTFLSFVTSPTKHPVT